MQTNCIDLIVRMAFKSWMSGSEKLLNPLCINVQLLLPRNSVIIWPKSNFTPILYDTMQEFHINNLNWYIPVAWPIQNNHPDCTYIHLKFIS